MNYYQENKVKIHLLIAFLLGTLVMGGIFALISNKQYSRLETKLDEYKHDQLNSQRNNAIIQRAVDDNKKIQERQEARAEEISNIVNEIIKPKSVSIK